MPEYLTFGYIVGYAGLVVGICVPIPQLYSILKHKHTKVSIWTYVFLFCALSCYLYHAIYIQAPVFIAAQSANLLTNAAILFLLLRYRNGIKG
jgi:uncharacterized protein with PQ loop repeat